MIYQPKSSQWVAQETFKIHNFFILTPNGQLFVEQAIENPGRFLWSQFWLDVYKIWTQGVNMYPLSGNVIFFQSDA